MEKRKKIKPGLAAFFYALMVIVIEKILVRLLGAIIPSVIGFVLPVDILIYINATFYWETLFTLIEMVCVWIGVMVAVNFLTKKFKGFDSRSFFLAATAIYLILGLLWTNHSVFSEGAAVVFAGLFYVLSKQYLAESLVRNRS